MRTRSEGETVAVRNKGRVRNGLTARNTGDMELGKTVAVRETEID